MKVEMKLNRYAVMGVALLLLLGCSSAPNKVHKQSTSNGEALAQAAFNYGQFDKAEAQYTTLLKNNPDNLEYQLMLGRSLYHQDKKETGMAQLRLVSQADDPVAAQAGMYLGRFLLLGDRVDDAIAIYQDALPKADSDEVKAQIHNGLGVALIEQDNQAAREHLQQAIGLSPDSVHFRSNLALSHLHDQDVVSARRVFAPLLAYQQLPAQVELNFAVLLLAEDKPEQARAILARHLPASEVERDLAILQARLVARKTQP